MPAPVRFVPQASLNGLLDEVARHKVAAGDALEASIRRLDDRIAAEQQGLAAAGSANESAAALAGFFAPPAGGVPQVGPGPATTLRSPVLESLYWERLGVLRTWTGLGIPTRADIR